jgi:hypothetical protein
MYHRDKVPRILNLSTGRQLHIPASFSFCKMSARYLLNRRHDSPQSHVNVKLKVNLSLCLTKHHAMKTYWGSGGIAPLILDLGPRCR